MPEFLVSEKYKEIFNEYDLSVIKAAQLSKRITKTAEASRGGYAEGDMQNWRDMHAGRFKNLFRPLLEEEVTEFLGQVGTQPTGPWRESADIAMAMAIRGSWR